jgi:mono/diheme cytochrome c family protein
VELILCLAAQVCLGQSGSGSDPIDRGQYLATAADCGGCHTVDPAKPMAGGYAVPTPLGAIYTPNITADAKTGIGSWTDEDFVRALQQGIGKNGEHLYPAFPYDSYTLLSRADILAIKAYLFSLKPIRSVTPANRLMFPFNHRWLLWGWKLLNFTPRRFEPDPGRSLQWNRGAYLVEALEHCGTCHTPRNLTLGVERGRALAGGDAGAWQAYNISADPVSGIGLWNDAELRSYLVTGKAPGKGYAAGPMAEAVEKSLRHLSDPDLSAILVYLRSVRPIRLHGDSKPRFDHGRPAKDEMSLRGIAGVTLSARPVSSAELFSGECASCHGADGKGSADGYYPSMFHDTVLGARTPNNLILVLLEGVQRQGTREAGI